MRCESRSAIKEDGMLLDEMTEEVIELAKQGDAKFLQIARILRELSDTLAAGPGPDKQKPLEDCLKKAKIGRRRAFYLIEIDRVYGQMPVPKKRLAAIGWTKLGLMAKYVEPDHADAWLAFAEKSTVEQLKAFLAGKDLPSHTLTFKLSNQQYSIIAGTLLANGAYLTSGAGLANKEAALTKICHVIQKSWQAGIS